MKRFIMATLVGALGLVAVVYATLTSGPSSQGYISSAQSSTEVRSLTNTAVARSALPRTTVTSTIFLPLVLRFMRGIEIGAFVYTSPPVSSTVRTFETLIGRHLASVLWYQGWDSSGHPSFPCSELMPVLYHDGYDTVLSFHLTWEPWVGLTDIANGIYDAYLTSYADELKNCGLKVRLRFAHEMIQNDVFDGQEWYPWQDQPEPYKAAFRHVHDVFRAAGANNVEFVWCPQNWPSQLSIVQKYYPGPQYVDWLCMDGYKSDGNDWNSGWFDDIFYNLYHTLVDHADVFGEKPVMIGEFGACEGPVKSAWITNAFDRIKGNYPEIRAFYWFDINKECDWRVESSAESLSVFTQAISGTMFVSHPLSTTTR